VSKGDYSIKQKLVEIAHVAMQVNLAKESKRLESRLQREVNALVA
jgi:hypothetical protein